MRTFVIGDVHGHADRLKALLLAAGVTEKDPETDQRRIVPGVEIVQLGDLGHFGAETGAGDQECYVIAKNLGMIVLWGNHDRAVVDPYQHSFRGYMYPGDKMRIYMHEMGLRNAYAADGFLLTHAGLHPHWMKNVPWTPVEAAEYLNWLTDDDPILNAIAGHRGGFDQAGGILWRDATELLASIPQVFGHTRGMPRTYNAGQSFCIDVGEKADPGNLVGMWLDTKEIVAVGPDAERHMKQLPMEGSLP